MLQAFDHGGRGHPPPDADDFQSEAPTAAFQQCTLLKLLSAMLPHSV